MSKAGDMFEAMNRWECLKDEMEDALCRACGILNEPPFDYPFSHFSFDDYDNSFEFKGVHGDWTPTPEQFAACWEFGFSRCWICYNNTDGGGKLTPNRGDNHQRDKYFTAPILDRVFPGEPESSADVR